MPVERVFLGWDRLPLIAAREWLLPHAVRLGPSLDLSHIALCLPTGRGGRLLHNLLLEMVGSGESGVLIPPTMFTPGSLLESLHTSMAGELSSAMSGVSASPLAMQLAWKAALDALSPDEFGFLSGGMVFDEEEPLVMASLVARSHGRLTPNLRSFQAAYDEGRTLLSGAIEPRLAALARAEARYVEALRHAGLEDRALELAVGARPTAAPSLPWKQLLLVGLLDIPAPLRRQLRDLAASGHLITSLVFAPASRGEMFDEIGGVVPAAWRDATLELGSTSITVVETTDDLIDTSLSAVAGLPRGTRTGDVVLGVTDAGATASLVRRGALCGLRVRPAIAGEMGRTPTALLVRSVLELCRERTFREWGGLLRHPWFERALRATLNPDEPSASEHWLEVLDRYVMEHLPNALTGRFVEKGDTLLPVLEGTLSILGDLAPPLEGGASRPAHRTLSQWARTIGEFLRRVVPPVPAEDPVAQGEADAFAAAVEMMEALARTPSLDQATGASVALSMVLDVAGSAMLPPHEVEGAVEAVGWLELALDPAPHVIVMGLSEGVVPSREPPDPLIPPALFKALGIDIPSTRLARDAAILTMLAHSRSLSIVTSRAGHDGEPNLPSRLLFQTDDSTLRARARLWSPDQNAVRVPVARPPARATLATSEFEAMRVPRQGVPERWSVTAFKDYLASPYLFYLKHVVRVQELDEPSPELLPHRFGTLIHAALREFGQSNDRSLTDSGKIRTALRERFEGLLAGAFGNSLSVPLWIQAQQALARLDGFAQWQADRTAQGWTIANTEWSPGPTGVSFAWEKGEIRLTGRIDRIDTHPDLGVALIDYKLYETAKTPEKTHRTKDSWIDLQLPLYRHLAGEFLEGREPALAYVTLAADGETKLHETSWDAAMLASADAAAREVIADVHAGLFQIQGSSPPTSRIFGALTGLGHLGVLDDGDDDEEGL